MTLQQIKYIVAALAIIQCMIALTALVIIIKYMVVGIRQQDKSKYKKAAVTFAFALAILIAIGIVQFCILVQWQ